MADADERGCPKCGHAETTTKRVSMTSSGLGKLLDIQSNTFEAVSCADCGYTEFYSAKRSRGMDVLDFFLGG